MKNKITTEVGFKGQAVILAGGFGTRLQSELGPDIPKPMAPIAGIPLLQHQLNLLSSHGFKRIIILVHHHAEYIKKYFQDGREFGLQIEYSTEKTPRGTAGAIYDCLPQLSDVFLVLYGDTYLDVNLSEFFNSKADKFAALTFCHPNSHPFDSDLLKCDSTGRVTSVFRSSQSGEFLYKNMVNAALYVLEKRIFQTYVDSDGIMDISSELFPRLLRNNEHIQAYKSVEYIKDMGTPKRYQDVKDAISSGAADRLSGRNKRVCLFLDRDGVINREVGHLNNLDQFDLLPNVAKAIELMNRNGILVICVTNQPVVARGDLSLDELSKIHMKMEVELGRDGAYLDDIYFCPHHPDSGFKGEIEELKIVCDCRKPKPGMILKALNDYNIDPTVSWLIGDHTRDIIAGEAAGINTMLIGQYSENNAGKERVFNSKNIDLLVACQKILKTINLARA